MCSFGVNEVLPLRNCNYSTQSNILKHRTILGIDTLPLRNCNYSTQSYILKHISILDIDMLPLRS